MFCLSINVLRLWQLQQKAYHSWTWKTTQNQWSFHCLLSIRYFQHFISFRNIFSQFKAKSDADILFFQVYHYLDTSNSQMKRYILVFNNMLLNNPVFYGLTPSRKWLSRLSYIYNEWQKLVLAALLSPHGQSGNFNCIVYFSWSTIICYIIFQKAYIEQILQFKLTANALSIITAI